ncbi:hypothetical protein FHW96_000225 [Novosphingobium sp. SG751A]|uniref:hypothetical protein n=1 Tax=Novosphingobium sp. SG751A TaxID=2587000 RepID=UPI0015521BDC|nr:hypothetical protein [Novosphingobium sp. SG751A]NOW44098.1 hypothetical protein [Novosphingobium sp. SG751A]
MEDMHSNIALAVAIAAAAYAADSTAVTIDRLGYDSLEIALNIGVGGITFSGTNKIEFVLTHSDDDSTYTAVADADMLGVSGITNGIIKALVAAHAAAAVYRFGYKGGKRYLKLVADFSGTHGTATPIAASAILGDPALAPVANQA